MYIKYCKQYMNITDRKDVDTNYTDNEYTTINREYIDKVLINSDYKAMKLIAEKLSKEKNVELLEYMFNRMVLYSDDYEDMFEQIFECYVNEDEQDLDSVSKYIDTSVYDYRKELIKMYVNKQLREYHIKLYILDNIILSDIKHLQYTENIDKKFVEDNISMILRRSLATGKYGMFDYVMKNYTVKRDDFIEVIYPIKDYIMYIEDTIGDYITSNIIDSADIFRLLKMNIKSLTVNKALYNNLSEEEQKEYLQSIIDNITINYKHRYRPINVSISMFIYMLNRYPEYLSNKEILEAVSYEATNDDNEFVYVPLLMDLVVLYKQKGYTLEYLKSHIPVNLHKFLLAGFTIDEYGDVKQLNLRSGYRHDLLGRIVYNNRKYTKEQLREMFGFSFENIEPVEMVLEEYVYSPIAEMIVDMLGMKNLLEKYL